MTDQKIRTRPDGSIDTAFYMRRGRRMRSEAAHGMVASMRDTIGAPGSSHENPPRAAEQSGWFSSVFRAFRPGW